MKLLKRVSPETETNLIGATVFLVAGIIITGLQTLLVLGITLIIR